jgi:hypothetical protein
MKVASSSSERILAGISKIYIEHRLLVSEFVVYTIAFDPLLQHCPTAVAVGSIGTFIIPYIRCWKSYKTLTLQIIDI